MRIAVLAHIRHAIPEPFNGGMEAHCAMLCHGLRAAGHQVDLSAATGSDDACLIPICDAPYDQVLPWSVYRGTERLADYQRAAFGRVFAHLEDRRYDVVHNNSLFPEIINQCAEAGIPCVTSQHVPPFAIMVEAVRIACDEPHVGITVTSRDQQSLWRKRGCDGVEVVSNGIDTEAWCPVDEAGDHLTWVGRIVPNKGLAEAVRAMAIAGAKLRIFGPIEDADYFSSHVEPFLDKEIEYCGHRSADTLRKEVASARGALVTPMWDELFGLVAAEALSCGTPVVGFDRGALAEVVGDCALLVEGGDVEGLADAIARVGSISRAACRQRAVQQLSIPAMIAGYERCYASVVAGCRSASEEPSVFSSSCSSTSALLA